MLRRLVTALLHLTMRIFFRRVEVAGHAQLDPATPVLFVLNHPNGLVDPVILLCHSPRPVAFLAKSTLFKMPGIAFLVRALDSLPVYRQQDAGSDTQRNLETFDKARSLMQRKVAIAIFPEGVSHNDPRLRPLKTGAARIALGARLEGLRIVPVGLYFLAKKTFRSSALVYFGESLEVPTVELTEGEPPREAVRDLTEAIQGALRKITLQAENHEAIALCERAERIFRAAAHEDTGPDDALAQRFTLRQRFIEGWAALRDGHGEALQALESRIDRYEAELERLHLDPEHLAPHEFSTSGSARYALRNGLVILLLLMPAIPGLLTHYPAYRLIGHLATRLAVRDKEGGDDSIATIKVLGAMLFFPLTWGLMALIFGLTLGGWAALVASLLTPLVGYAALLLQERIEKVAGATRSLFAFLSPRHTLARLHQERVEIRNDIRALGKLL